MDKLMASMQTIRTFVLRLTELGFVLVGFIVLIYLLLGENSGDFAISVIANLSVLVDILTPNVLIGLALVLFLGTLLRGRR